MISGLQLWEDHKSRTPAGQMAMDEAMLVLARRPVVRFYRWAAPAVTFGYAQRYPRIQPGARGLPLIRRWTGGGVVFHGEDLTMALAVPATGPLCRMRAAGIYQQIHAALLTGIGQTMAGARLATPGDCRPGLACFQSPALHDILHDGKKICGGALRMCGRGFLYQGSVHGMFVPRTLGHALSGSVVRFEPDDELLRLGDRLATDKYGTPDWNQLR